MILRLCSFLCSAVALTAAQPRPGADVPWATYEAEDMAFTGEKLGPKYEPFQVETESSGQQCVKLAAGQYVEFKPRQAANALVVRYSLPDAEQGGGLESTLSLYQNGKLVQTLPLTSRYSWLYGRYPFTNNPKDGKPRNFYDEVRVKDLSIAPGDVLRLQKESNAPAPYCIIDLVDLENVPAPLTSPVNSLSITEPRFGAVGNGEADDTAALRECLKAALATGRTVWLPAGTYKICGDIDLASGATIQGAGMWHTTLVGDPAQYSDVHKRVRLNGWGGNIHLSDFALVGKLTFRNDTEPNDGINGWFGANSVFSRLWVEHTKAGIWAHNSSNLVVTTCRFRNTVADGVNFCVGMRASIVRNCAARGTGDDSFAIWPAVYAPQDQAPGGNLISHCTAQVPFLANGAAIYGGESNRIEDCAFTDIGSGCGILISSSFPTADADRGVDNNFSGLTVVQRCELRRSGGYDHEWGWRAAFQLCVDRRNISGLDLRDLTIQDSISDGFSVIAREKPSAQSALSNACLANVRIPNCGIGTAGRHGLWIRHGVCGKLTVRNSTIVGEENNSTTFIIQREPLPANAGLPEQKTPTTAGAVRRG